MAGTGDTRVARRYAAALYQTIWDDNAEDRLDHSIAELYKAEPDVVDHNGSAGHGAPSSDVPHGDKPKSDPQQEMAAAMLQKLRDENAQSRIDAAITDLSVVEEMLASHPNLRAVIVHPLVSDERKQTVIDQAFKATLGKNTFNLLSLLVRNRREELIDPIISEFRRIADEKAGRLEALVETSIALDPEQVARLQAALEQRTGKTVRLNAVIDPALLGGVRVRIGDDVIDAGLKSRLERLHALLLAAK